MSASEIIEAVLAAGGQLELRGSRIHYRVPQEFGPLLNQLRRHKPDVLYLLKRDERRKACCHLLPYLGKRVWSPAGPGKLLIVDDYVTVAFEDGVKMRWDDPKTVIPYA